MTGVRMGRRPLLAMALGWVLVVAAVAVVTFIVVDRAGRGVGQASAARTVAPVPTIDVSGTAESTPAPTRSDPLATPAPQPTPRTQSFTTEGGTVVASCDGEEVTLESITVRDGWRFEQELERGRLEVKFESRQGDIDDVEIDLGCVAGVPTRSDA